MVDDETDNDVVDDGDDKVRESLSSTNQPSQSSTNMRDVKRRHSSRIMKENLPSSNSQPSPISQQTTMSSSTSSHNRPSNEGGRGRVVIR